MLFLIQLMVAFPLSVSSRGLHDAVVAAQSFFLVPTGWLCFHSSLWVGTEEALEQRFGYHLEQLPSTVQKDWMMQLLRISLCGAKSGLFWGALLDSVDGCFPIVGLLQGTA